MPPVRHLVLSFVAGTGGMCTRRECFEGIWQHHRPPNNIASYCATGVCAQDSLLVLGAQRPQVCSCLQPRPALLWWGCARPAPGQFQGRPHHCAALMCWQQNMETDVFLTRCARPLSCQECCCCLLVRLGVLPAGILYVLALSVAGGVTPRLWRLLQERCDMQCGSQAAAGHVTHSLFLKASVGGRPPLLCSHPQAGCRGSTFLLCSVSVRCYWTDARRMPVCIHTRGNTRCGAMHP